MSTTTTKLFPHYIFGYGSLICPSSRAITAPTLKHRVATPVRVQQLERLWSFPVQACGMTFMGVRIVPPPSPDKTVKSNNSSSCVGVLVPVNDTELAQFDLRELGYDRVPIEQHHVERIITSTIDNSSSSSCSSCSSSSCSSKSTKHKECNKEEEDYLFPPPVTLSEQQQQQQQQQDATSTSSTSATLVSPQIWVYVQQAPSPTSKDCPIAQTYLDIILRGCLTISEDFARDFLTTTKGWHAQDACFDVVEQYDDPDTTTTTTTNTTSSNKNNSSSSSSKRSLAADCIGEKEEEKEKEENSKDDFTTFWVNDRNDPLYVRADVDYSKKNAHELDRLLERYRPAFLAQRRPFNGKSYTV